MKYNIDGACKGNPRFSSYGFCIRDISGDLVYAEADTIGITTNIVAKATAIWKTLQYCQTYNIQGIMLESDSLCLIRYLKRQWKIPWEVIELI